MKHPRTARKPFKMRNSNNLLKRSALSRENLKSEIKLLTSKRSQGLAQESKTHQPLKKRLLSRRNSKLHPQHKENYNLKHLKPQLLQKLIMPKPSKQKRKLRNKEERHNYKKRKTLLEHHSQNLIMPIKSNYYSNNI